MSRSTKLMYKLYGSIQFVLMSFYSGLLLLCIHIAGSDTVLPWRRAWAVGVSNNIEQVGDVLHLQ